MWLVGRARKVLACVDTILLLLFTQQAGYEFRLLLLIMEK
jgi:hypothetical protein